MRARKASTPDIREALAEHFRTAASNRFEHLAGPAVRESREQMLVDLASGRQVRVQGWVLNSVLCDLGLAEDMYALPVHTHVVNGVAIPCHAYVVDGNGEFVPA